MTILEEKAIRIESAEIAVEKVLARFGLVSDEISQREACRMSGITRAILQSWENEGLLKGLKTGEGNSKKTYSRIELQTIIRLKQQRKIK